VALKFSQMGCWGCRLISKSLANRAALMRGKLERPSKPHAAPLGSLPAFAGSGPDQRPLEFGEASQDRQHQHPMGRGRHQASLSERKPAPACFTASKTFNRSRVEREIPHRRSRIQVDPTMETKMYKEGYEAITIEGKNGLPPRAERLCQLSV
jgi:hypothetical protein